MPFTRRGGREWWNPPKKDIERRQQAVKQQKSFSDSIEHRMGILWRKLGPNATELQRPELIKAQLKAIAELREISADETLSLRLKKDLRSGLHFLYETNLTLTPKVKSEIKNLLDTLKHK